MTTAEILREARALIDTREKWTTGGVCDPQGRHCALGAVAHVVLGDAFPDALDSNYSQVRNHPAVMVLADAMAPDFPWTTDTDAYEPVEVVYHTNDRRKSHKFVLAAFDRAIALADQEQS